MSIGKVVAVSALSLVSAAVGAYVATKVYPKVKNDLEDGKSKTEIAKEVAKTAAPAVGALGSAVALTALTTIGNRNPIIRDFTNNYKSATKKSDDMMYLKNIKPRVGKDVEDILVYDMFTDCYVETNRIELEKAVAKINQDLVFGGSVKISDLYSHLRAFDHLNNKFQDYGWDWDLADRLHVEPWISVELEQTWRPVGGGHDPVSVFTLRYLADRGDGRNYIFDPIPCPQSKKTAISVYPEED